MGGIKQDNINKKITIATVTFNCQDIIEDTIRSVLMQSYDNIEYIVIDGASKDDTLIIINKYSSNIHHIICEPDCGIYDAMNKAIKLATGDWIFFLNAGDVFASNDILKDIFGKEVDTNNVIVCNYKIRTNGGTVQKIVIKPFYLDCHEYVSMGFHHQSVFVPVPLAKRNMFDMSFKCCADYNMIMKIYKNGGTFLQIPVFVTIIEGRCGFSHEHRKQQFLEEAKIRGVDNTIKFKFKFLIFNIKQSIKKIIGIYR